MQLILAQQGQIRIGDWHRILFGDAPALVAFEVLLRATVLFVTLIAVVRLLGKRMSGQLTITEMAVLLMLGAIAGNGMQIPQRGLVQAIFVFGCVLLFQRTLTWVEVKSPRAERITQGNASLIVKDGVVQYDAMKAARISHDQLFAQLRQRGINNLGRVRRVYLEGSGVFSVFQAERERPGLWLLPESDQPMRQRARPAPGQHACACCGLTTGSEVRECPNCGRTAWDDAVLQN